LLAHPHPAPGAVRAGVYTRIFSDPSGQRAGVERQRADCEEYCLTRGGRIAELFEDNDYSASSGKRRPAHERMLAAVESRRVDGIVTWHNDRLHRAPRELEAFIDLVERTRVRLALVTGGDYDLTTRDGRSRRGSSARWPARSPRTAAGAYGESTLSWPNRADQPASSGGGCGRTRSGSSSETQQRACSPATV
jgi:hypothetical protein